MILFQPEDAFGPARSHGPADLDGVDPGCINPSCWGMVHSKVAKAECERHRSRYSMPHGVILVHVCQSGRNHVVPHPTPQPCVVDILCHSKPRLLVTAGQAVVCSCRLMA